jgi:hypothetical protein
MLDIPLDPDQILADKEASVIFSRGLYTRVLNGIECNIRAAIGVSGGQGSYVCDRKRRSRVWSGSNPSLCQFEFAMVSDGVVLIFNQRGKIGYACKRYRGDIYTSSLIPQSRHNPLQEESNFTPWASHLIYRHFG